MSIHHPDVQPLFPPISPPPIPSVTAEPSVTAPTALTDLPPVSAAYIWLMVLAQLGVFVAFITPMAISLSIRLTALAPGQEQVLGYILGAGSAAAMIAGPLLGTLSDRTRTRFGRRRPWMMLGVLIGVVSLFVMALAPSILTLGLGWVLAQISWGSMVLSNLGASQADRLPEAQRGKVAGLVGFATQIGPVLGFLIAGGLARDHLLLFLVPGAVGVLLNTLFIAFIREPVPRTLPDTSPLTLAYLIRELGL